MAENLEVVELGHAMYNCPASDGATEPGGRPAASSSSVYYSARIEGLRQIRAEFETSLDFEIEASKGHWSELQAPSGEANGATRMTDAEIVRSLRNQFPQSGEFFAASSDSLQVGKKIGEGAQAEIFEARWLNSEVKYALKVFKAGWSVTDLQKQWPLGMLNGCGGGFVSSSLLHRSRVLGGTVVMNGRFAFRMFQYAGDLRKLIDLRMERNNGRRAPFCDAELVRNMQQIAMGMEGLHKDLIVHRDLKASNILIDTSPHHLQLGELVDFGPFRHDVYSCLVADFECSVGVVGTGFWRAPEILQGVKARKITPDLFTKEADVYSYAMTLYEMITGRLPFEGVKLNDYDVVLRGGRPELPHETKPWIKTLLNRCWHSDPTERPSFQEILKCIEESS